MRKSQYLVNVSAVDLYIGVDFLLVIQNLYKTYTGVIFSYDDKSRNVNIKKEYHLERG